MSRDATIEILFAGDTRTFKLAIENILALEDSCDAGCAELLERLSTGRWRVRDVIEPIRLGLIGHGVEPRMAKRMVDETITPGRLSEHVLIAQAIIMTALVGDPREQVGKDQAATDPTEATDAFPPPQSTASPGPSGNLSAKSSA